MKRAAIVALAILVSWWLATGRPVPGGAPAPLMAWLGSDHLPMAIGLLATLLALALGGGTPERR